MSETIKKFLVGLAVIIILLALAGNRDFRTFLRQREEIHKLEDKLKTQIELNKSLKQEIYLAETNLAYIEKIARQKLGLIQQGEIIYKFVDTDKN
ncbi:MAG: septum formation initiator family protein [Elusimicrobiota bacterium]